MQQNIIMEAGAITFRNIDNEKKVLLIRSKKNPSHWIFPKGHVEKNETVESAALRELLEEAGIAGKYLKPASDLKFTLNNSTYNVSYHAVDFIKKEHEGEPGRDPQWLSVPEAIDLLSFADTKEMLRKIADQV